MLTLIPRGTRPGLEVQADHGTRLGRWEVSGGRGDEQRPTSLEEQASWRRIERDMGEDEAIIFGGVTLARLTGIRALRHRVFTDGQVRFSAPFFQVTRCALHPNPTP